MAAGTISDSTILALQVSASLLMAADYFFDEKARSSINKNIQKAATRIQGILHKDNRNVAKEILEQKWPIYVLGLVCALAAVIGTYFYDQIKPWSVSWSISQAALLGILYIVAAIALHDFFIVAGANILLNTPILLISAFIKYCQKGSIFGVGFVILMASFVCRYLNLP